MHSATIWVVLLALLLLSAPVHAAGLAVTGQVLDSQGKPVPGARLELVPQIGSVAAGKLVAQGRSTPDPVAQAASDAQGRFVLTAPEVGMWQVVVRAPGSVPRAFPLTPLLEPVDLPVVKLEPDAGIRVRVLDREGRPLAGARVTVRPDPYSPEAWGVAPRLGITAEDGTAVLPRGKREALGLTASAPGHLEASSDAVSSASIEMRLQAGTQRAAVPSPPSPRTGRVLEAGTRKPVAGAFVWPAEAAGDFVRTNEQGVYTLAVPVSPQGGFLQAAAPGYVEALESHRSPTAGPTFSLRPVAWVRGLVEDAKGKPVAGAEIAVSPLSSGRNFPRTERLLPKSSDPKGRFQLRLPPGLRYEVTISHPEFAPFTTRWSALAPHEERSGLRIVLDPGRTASGRVLDPQKRPVAGAEVWLRQAEAGIYPVEHQADSDADGRFLFSHLPPGRFNLEVRAPGFAPEVKPGLHVQAGDLDLGTILLEPGALLAGRVVDRQERPIEGAEVRIGTEYSLPRFSPEAGEDENDPQKVVTGADGRFTFSDLKPGKSVMVMAAGKGYAAGSLEVEVPAEQPVTIVLAPGFRISGRVVDGQGSAVPDVGIMLLGTGSAGFSMEEFKGGASDREGRFTFEGIAPGRFSLQTFAPGYLESTRNLEIAGKDLEGVEIVLERGALLTGKVIGPDNAPVVGARVEVVQSLFQQQSIMHIEGESGSGELTDGDGNYRLDSVPAGWRSIAARHPEFQRAVRDIEIRPGENQLDLRMEPGLGISGRVLDPEGRPVEGVDVILMSFSADFHDTTSDADGAFHFSGVAAGLYQLQVFSMEQNQASSSLQVRVTDAPVAGLELRLEDGTETAPGLELTEQSPELEVDGEGPDEPATFVVRGRVVDARDDTPLARAKVVLEPVAERPQLDAWLEENLTDSEGSFLLERVAEGTYRVVARKDGYAPEEATITVTESEAPEVRLALATAEGLTVEVLSPDGTPPVLVITSLVDPASGRLIVMDTHAAGENGRVRIASAPPGRWKLVVAVPDSALTQVDVTVPGPVPRIVLSPAARISVVVPDLIADGRSGVLTILDADGRTFPWGFGPSEIPIPQGKTDIDALPAGTWTVRVTAPDGRSWQGNVTTVAGSQSEVILK